MKKAVWAKASLKNQGGQLVVEAVLLMSLLLFISYFVQTSLRETQFAQRLVAKPWEKLQGMIECGTWQACGAGLHPNARSRQLTYDPRVP